MLQDFPRGLNTTFEWEITAGGKDFKDPLTGMEFVFVKGGCFQMGDTFGDGDADAKPVHEVCVDDFYLGKYEVTQRQWREVMGNNPSYFKNCGDDCPVEQVSWNDVQEFMKKLNNKSGSMYRLPKEAEWEYAARSGGKMEKWAGMSIESDLDKYAIKGTVEDEGIYSDGIGSVGQKKPNGLGIYDMSGNVWEWCSDWYDVSYYKNSPKDNPKGPGRGDKRVLRGGSWTNDPRYVRTDNRFGSNPDSKGSDNGFRLLRTK